jgi:hypothetical protein
VEWRPTTLERTVKDPNYPSEQPKDAVSDALTDRNSDPDALAPQDEPLKVHGDALLHGRKGSESGGKDEAGRDEQR